MIISPATPPIAATGPVPSPAPAAAPAVTPAASPAAPLPPLNVDPNGTYIANLATADGKISVQLLPKIAPNAVSNFVHLANAGFYRNVPIHRMIPGFMMQSGDPTGTGTGGPGYNIADDPVPAGMTYDKGVVAMANTGAPNSAGSQFFIMLGKVDLPQTYSIFGKVTQGLDVLDRIAAHKVVDNGQGEISKPEVPMSIGDITITTK